MLTSDLIRPRLRLRGDELTVDMIDVESRHWLKSADDMIQLFQRHRGQPLRNWQESLDEYEGERLDYVVVRGLAKVLTDNATFSSRQIPVEPVALRQRLFTQGPVFSHPDLFHTVKRQTLIEQVAAEYSVTPEDIEKALFADRPEESLLVDIGQAWTPATLLSRYNLELARGVLYWAREMHLEVHDNYKDLWKFIKLFKLMFEAKPLSDGGYQIVLDGPISPFVHATLRYGRQFASFLPALFLGEQWCMTATVHPPNARETAEYRLDDSLPLVSHFKRSGTFDSLLEKNFATEFEEKFGSARGNWKLSREDEVLILTDTVFIPDFAITHKTDGRRALVELGGFWHPDYLRRKVAKVRAAKRKDILLVVYEGVNLAPDALQDVPGEVLYFKNKPVLKDVMAAVERIAC